MKLLVIEKKALKNNIAIVKERAGSAAIYGVVTGDGGGAGTVELAKLLRDEGVRRFAVAEPAEAAALRKAGLVDEEILMLRSTTDRKELDQLIDLNVVCTVGSVESGLALNGTAEARSTVAEAHIQVDTGLGFGGFLTNEPEKIINVYRNLPNVAISGIYTQVHANRVSGQDACADLDVFRQTLEAIHKAGFETGVVHAAGSFALLHFDFARMDAVRAGSVLLGRCRRRRGDGLLRVGYGEVSIEETRWLPKGHTIGYGRLTTLKRPTRVAVLPVGYQNGFGVSHSRDAGLWSTLRRWWRGRRITVRVGSQKARVLGQIGAIETLVDITDLKCSAGDPVYFDIDPLYARGLKREYR
ncbi:alanine racemase [Pseudoflavonifractor sp. 524-17]|uniref:alanine racemase n=1 Tax=Pseudoflavonifractor sp. 524-17 TaxID=2304577 RepID=UPI00137B778C|nr:alanine racemase [Pseudoflavonifractor sp. 524-17]NCE63623.1 alanine racemase [Pseudoflavonifractor sp. 524-17]